jgi:ABC-type transport system involved in multi-copper enzyme maturation permease subunit
MPKTFIIAGNTLREALRERLLYNLVVFALLLVAGSLTISRLTLGEQFRIIANIGTSATQVFGTLIAVFLGVGLVTREIDRRTSYTVLARPVSRAGFVVGKYLGLLVTLALNVTLMATATAITLAVYRGDVAFLDRTFAGAFALMVVQLAICAAFAVLFSTFSTATLSSIFTLALVGAGWLFGEVRIFWLRANDVGMKGLVRVLDYALPNMGLLDLKEAVTYSEPVSVGSMLARGAYGAAYASLLVALGALVFSRRDIR